MAQIHILQKTDGPESQPTDPSNKASGGRGRFYKASGGRCRFFQLTLIRITSGLKFSKTFKLGKKLV